MKYKLKVRRGEIDHLGPNVMISASDEYCTIVEIQLSDGQKVTVYVQPDYVAEPKVYVNIG